MWWGEAKGWKNKKVVSLWHIFSLIRNDEVGKKRNAWGGVERENLGKRMLGMIKWEKMQKRKDISCHDDDDHPFDPTGLVSHNWVLKRSFLLSPFVFGYLPYHCYSRWSCSIWIIVIMMISRFQDSFVSQFAVWERSSLRSTLNS